MAFMQPEYTNEDFVGMTDGECDDIFIPASVENLQPTKYSTFERHTGKYWARLSASGYLDATEWAGPFDTIEEARDYIEEQFEVDADTGEELEYV